MVCQHLNPSFKTNAPTPIPHAQQPPPASPHLSLMLYLTITNTTTVSRPNRPASRFPSRRRRNYRIRSHWLNSVRRCRLLCRSSGSSPSPGDGMSTSHHKRLIVVSVVRPRWTTNPQPPTLWCRACPSRFGRFGWIVHTQSYQEWKAIAQLVELDRCFRAHQLRICLPEQSQIGGAIRVSKKRTWESWTMVQMHTKAETRRSSWFAPGL